MQDWIIYCTIISYRLPFVWFSSFLQCMLGFFLFHSFSRLYSLPVCFPFSLYCIFLALLFWYRTSIRSVFFPFIFPSFVPRIHRYSGFSAGLSAGLYARKKERAHTHTYTEEFDFSLFRFYYPLLSNSNNMFGAKIYDKRTEEDRQSIMLNRRNNNNIVGWWKETENEKQRTQQRMISINNRKMHRTKHQVEANRSKEEDHKFM